MKIKMLFSKIKQLFGTRNSLFEVFFSVLLIGLSFLTTFSANSLCSTTPLDVLGRESGTLVQTKYDYIFGQIDSVSNPENGFSKLLIDQSYFHSLRYFRNGASSYGFRTVFSDSPYSGSLKMGSSSYTKTFVETFLYDKSIYHEEHLNQYSIIASKNGDKSWDFLNNSTPSIAISENFAQQIMNDSGFSSFQSLFDSASFADISFEQTVKKEVNVSISAIYEDNNSMDSFSYRGKANRQIFGENHIICSSSFFEETGFYSFCILTDNHNYLNGDMRKDFFEKLDANFPSKNYSLSFDRSSNSPCYSKMMGTINRVKAPAILSNSKVVFFFLLLFTSCFSAISFALVKRWFLNFSHIFSRKACYFWALVAISCLFFLSSFAAKKIGFISVSSSIAFYVLPTNLYLSGIIFLLWLFFYLVFLFSAFHKKEGSAYEK